MSKDGGKDSKGPGTTPGGGKGDEKGGKGK